MLLDQTVNIGKGESILSALSCKVKVKNYKGKKFTKSGSLELYKSSEPLDYRNEGPYTKL
jgi:hypothetical protein